MSGVHRLGGLPIPVGVWSSKAQLLDGGHSGKAVVAWPALRHWGFVHGRAIDFWLMLYPVKPVNDCAGPVGGQAAGALRMVAETLRMRHRVGGW